MLGSIIVGLIGLICILFNKGIGGYLYDRYPKIDYPFPFVNIRQRLVIIGVIFLVVAVFVFS